MWRQANSPSTLTSKEKIVVIFYEILLVLVSVLITWFSLYVLYRLITDDSHHRYR
ncbi:hypothetical protein Rwratislav_21738 [Rhodococcus wratislaviensis IFP 2016]|nr:hypothetical protein Rwratislav_21738 [Rhodococcus wratislaviensis IFP 2016]